MRKKNFSTFQLTCRMKNPLHDGRSNSGTRGTRFFEAGELFEVYSYDSSDNCDGSRTTLRASWHGEPYPSLYYLEGLTVEKLCSLAAYVPPTLASLSIRSGWGYATMLIELVDRKFLTLENVERCLAEMQRDQEAGQQAPDVSAEEEA